MNNYSLLSYSWLIPAFPILSGSLLFLFRKILKNNWPGILASISIGLSTFLTYIISFSYISSDRYDTLIVNNIDWLQYGHNIKVDLGVLIDPLSILLLIVICTISFLVHIYSIGYMFHDNGKVRFFIYINFFTASMLGLVLSINILQSFFFWELVGAFSFLLIGFYYKKKSARSAAKKAFIITRFADLGFLLGILTLGYLNFNYFSEITDLMFCSTNNLQNLDIFSFSFINDPTNIFFFQQEYFVFYGTNIITIASFFIFLGACGKSAMFPLHVWLPDAMEGPTPVSALIHAATMVVAGIFLVGRIINIFTTSTTLMIMITYVGVITSLIGALIACTQDEIKKILAFSTISQLGYMMLALGISTSDNLIGYSASMFHLFTHAFFKALLFLGAGAIIHLSGTNNIWKMDSKFLYKKKLMLSLYFIGTCAISGIPPLSGFFSKDHIFLALLDSNNYFVLLLSLLVAFLTSFYMFRLFFVVFYMKNKLYSMHIVKEKHSVEKSMYFSMIILAFFSCFTGFVNIENFVTYNLPIKHIYNNYTVIITSIIISFFGAYISKEIYLNKYVFFRNYIDKSTWISFLKKILEDKLYIDLFYLFFSKKIMFNIISKCVVTCDKRIIDGTVNMSGKITTKIADILLFIQTSQIQTYIIWFMMGFISFFIILL